MNNQLGPHADAGTQTSRASQGAVFISHASEDAEAAGRIAAPLQAAGIEVWLDKTVLRSGDAWDQKIRREIRDCALFIAVISRNTEARAEGYFRLEWRLADQRTHLMAKSRPFLIPVCIDETPEEHAEVPESFSLVHWTRLPAGETPAAFVDRMLQLLSTAHHHPLPHAAPDATLPATVDSARVTAVAHDARRRTSTRALTGKLRRATILGGSTLIIAGAMLWLAANRGYFWRDPLANAQFSRVTDWSGTEQAAARPFSTQWHELRAVCIPAGGAAGHLEAGERREPRAMGRLTLGFRECARHRARRPHRIHGRTGSRDIVVCYAKRWRASVSGHGVVGAARQRGLGTR